MNTSDTTTGNQHNPARPEHDFQHLKEDVTEALGGARQQADAQFGQYRDTAADQIEALAKGAKSVVSELESKDTLGMSDYLADMADSMSGLAGNLRGKSAEQLLHDGAELARNNPALFIAGSIALGFGLSRFLKAGSAPATTVTDPVTRPKATRCHRQAASAPTIPTKLPCRPAPIKAPAWPRASRQPHPVNRTTHQTSQRPRHQVRAPSKELCDEQRRSRFTERKTDTRT